jgi:hypothetical protein
LAVVRVRQDLVEAIVGGLTAGNLAILLTDLRSADRLDPGRYRGLAFDGLTALVLLTVKALRAGFRSRTAQNADR